MKCGCVCFAANRCGLLVGVSRARREQNRTEQNTTQHNTTDTCVSLPSSLPPFLPSSLSVAFSSLAEQKPVFHSPPSRRAAPTKVQKFNSSPATAQSRSAPRTPAADLLPPPQNNSPARWRCFIESSGLCRLSFLSPRRPPTAGPRLWLGRREGDRSVNAG